MSRRPPPLDATALDAVLRKPCVCPLAVLDRQHRVMLLGEAAQLLLASRTEAGIFVGGAIQSMLTNGGDLSRDYLRITGKAGSHRTATSIWREVSSSRGATESECASTVAAPSTNASIKE